MTIPDTVTRERLDLEEMRILAKNATPGRWYMAGNGYVRSKYIDRNGHDVNTAVVQAYDHAGENERTAEYIAYANPARVLALIEIIGVMEDALDRISAYNQPNSHTEEYWAGTRLDRECLSQIIAVDTKIAREARAKVRELAGGG